MDAMATMDHSSGATPWHRHNPPAMGTILSRWLTLTAALPWLALWPTYAMGRVILSQVGVTRSLGVALVGALAIATLSGLLSFWPIQSRQRRVLWMAWYAGAIANLYLAGLSVFYLTPRLAPSIWQGIVPALWCVTLWRYATLAPTEQKQIREAFLHFSRAVYILLLASVPFVTWAAWHDVAHHNLSPLAPTVAERKPQAPRRIILLTFDGLRARSIHTDGPRHTATPHFSELAQQSTVYPDCRAAADVTLVSIPTILSGIRPDQYFPQSATPSMNQRQGFLTGMAGFLRAAGYRTHFATMLLEPAALGFGAEFDDGRMIYGLFRPNLFNTAAWLPLNACAQWWKEKASFTQPPETAINEVAAVRETFDHALNRLDSDAPRSMVWMHVGAPHTPYYDIPGSDATLATTRPTRYSRVTESDVVAGTLAQRQSYERIYERYVHFLDAEVGRLVQRLQQQHLWKDTLLIVTSDHGEDFRQLGKMPHGNGILTDDITRVPLLIHHPGQRTGEYRFERVSHIDILPTVLDLVYRQPPTGLQGLALGSQTVPGDRILATWGLTSHYLPGLKQAQSMAFFSGQDRFECHYPGPDERLFPADATAPSTNTDACNRWHRLVHQQFNLPR